MARSTKDKTKGTDVEEYDAEGFEVEDRDVETTTWEPGDTVPETITALDPSGEPVEIALSESHQSDLAYETAAVDEDVVDDRDWEGKEEDAELSRQQHELGIDNQLLDPNENRDV